MKLPSLKLGGWTSYDGPEAPFVLEGIFTSGPSQPEALSWSTPVPSR